MFRNLSEAYLSVKLLKLALPELVLVLVLGLALVCPVFSLFSKACRGFSRYFSMELMVNQVLVLK